MKSFLLILALAFAVSHCSAANVTDHTHLGCYATDKNEHCPAWARQGHCSMGSHVQYMKENCVKSCNPCMICQDDNENCPAWASLGHCQDDSHAEYMYAYCKKSCRHCFPSTAFSALKDKPIKDGDGELVVTQESILRQMKKIAELCWLRNNTCGIWKSGTNGWDETTAFESERCYHADYLFNRRPGPGSSPVEEDNWFADMCKVSCDICSSECGYVAKSTKRYRFQCKTIFNVCEGRLSVPGRQKDPDMSLEWPGINDFSCLHFKPQAFEGYYGKLRPRFLTWGETYSLGREKNAELIF